MIPGDFQFKKPTKGRLLKLGVLGVVSLGIVVGLGFVFIFVISAWLGRPVVFGFNEGPTQPIAFPHQRHVQDLGMDCVFCHRQVTQEAAATIPSAGLCMTCHLTVGDGKPGIDDPKTGLRAMVASGHPIEWTRVHRVPDHVHFVHEAHIRFFTQRDGIAPQAVCSTCHGDVTATPKVRQNRSLKMGDCVDCHRQNAAPTDCVTCHY